MTDNEKRREAVVEILKKVGLSEEHYFRFPHELSGGQVQRLGIAGALIIQPKLIVCDEPVSALDVSIQAQILNMLVELQKELGLSLLFISHDIGVVRFISDRIGVMYLGTLMEETETEAGKKKVRIHEMHMEEDAGKLIHDEWEDCSLVDYNRSGVPLIEIVSEPDMRSADEVIAYLEKLRMICQYLGASDCKLQEGSMRADVNLSVREVGASEFGTRTEMKNLNSFKAITHAIEGERQRQIELIEEGKKVIQETRRWDDNKEYSYAMRSKEDAQDYRYFPEPDLVPIVISDEWIQKIKDQQPELRNEKLARYEKDYDIPRYDAELITGTKKMADLFEATCAICNKPKKVSNWLMVETMRLLNENGQEPADIKFSPENLAKLIELADAGTINSSVAKEVFEKVFAEDVDPEKYVEDHGLKTVNDEGALRTLAEEVIAKNPKAVEDFKGGKEKALGALVGQIMKAMKGKANPGMVNELLREMLK